MSRRRERQAFFGGIGLSLRADPAVADLAAAVEGAIGFIRVVGEFVHGPVNAAARHIAAPCALQIAGAEMLRAPALLHRLLDAIIAASLLPELTTYGHWVESREQVRDVLSPFARKLGLLTVSVSEGLTAARGLSPVETIIEMARELDVKLNIHCYISPGHPFPRALLALESVNSANSIIRGLPAVAANSGSFDVEAWRPYLIPEPPLRRPCNDLMGIVIDVNGDVYPCARSLGQPAMRLGNLASEPVAAIVARAVGQPALIRLHAEGPRHLYDACRSSPHRGALRSGFLDSCDCHMSLLADPALAHVVQAVEPW
jgi:radical SAM protein with 4Fe4S-binding SPASM domain